jgi:beta-glucosidase
MSKKNLVPGEWGALAVAKPLTSGQMEDKANGLLAQMTLAEKVGQMSGDAPLISGTLDMMRAYNYHPIPAGENLRLGIPGIRFSDGPRGIVMYHSTCFPVSMARGATWDPEMEARVGDAIGVEARSQGANFFGGVCINLLRHPAWGRAQETYGEDPFHLGEMGAALVRGVQRHIMACAKHYACNSIENTRMKVDVHVDERPLREVYLSHFKRCVDEGVAAVMSAYNQVNSLHCGHNPHLLRDILKSDWAFPGFVVSDFTFGVRDAMAAANAGLDIEMPTRWHYHQHLQKLVEAGRVPLSAVDEAVLRILRQKIRFAQVGEPGRYGPQTVVSAEHRALAREVAQKGIVLLQNAPLSSGRRLLPLPRVGCIAVIGKLATAANTGDLGSSMVRPPAVVTLLEGIRAAAGKEVTVLFDDGARIAAATTVARKADVAIIVAGYRANDEALIGAVAAENPNTVVVLIGGSAVITEAWRGRVPAILMAWYPGMEGGHAVADILFGRANPSGRLSCVFPRAAEHMPFFDSRADSIQYGLFHGYRLTDREGFEPAFPFGFGLSYTTFAYQNLQLDRSHVPGDGLSIAEGDDSVQVSVDVTNTGPLAGAEVVQLYVGCEGHSLAAGDGSRVERPPKELKGFVRVELASGETRRVQIPLAARQLAYYEQERGDWRVEPSRYRVLVGPSSRDADLLQGQLEVTV